MILARDETRPLCVQIPVEMMISILQTTKMELPSVIVRSDPTTSNVEAMDTAVKQWTVKVANLLPTSDLPLIMRVVQAQIQLILDLVYEQRVASMNMMNTTQQPKHDMMNFDIAVTLRMPVSSTIRFILQNEQ